jgi:shikimate 5-dehydrogenase
MAPQSLGIGSGTFTDITPVTQSPDPYEALRNDKGSIDEVVRYQGPIPPWAVLVITREDLNQLRKEYTTARSMGFQNFQIRFDHLRPTKGPESKARFGVYITQISTLTRSNSIASLPGERHGGLMSESDLPESARIELLGMIATKGFQWIELEEDIDLEELKMLSRKARSSGTPVMLSSYPAKDAEWTPPPPEVLELCEGYKVNLEISDAHDLKRAIGTGKDLRMAVPGKVIVIRGAPPSQREFAALSYHYGSDLAFLESRTPGRAMNGGDPIKEKFQLENRIWRSLNLLEDKGSDEWSLNRISLNPDTDLCLQIGRSNVLSRKVFGFNELLKRMGLDAVMIPLDPGQGDLSLFIDMAKRFGIRGISIGIPYMNSAMGRMDWLDPTSEKIGAINLAIGKGGKFYGYNTEVYGIADVISAEIKAKGGKALILGTGASGRAASLACSLLKRETFLAGSDMMRTSRIALSLGSGIRAVDLRSLERSKVSFDIVINTIPFDQGSANLESVLLGAELVRRIEPMLGLEMTVFDNWTPFLSSIESRGGLPVQGKQVQISSLVRDHELIFGKRPEPSLVEEMFTIR